MPRRWNLYLWIFVFLSLGLTGCAFKKFAYDHADWFAMHKINQFFGPTSAQKKVLEPQVKAYIAWVKKEQAPKAIEFMKDIHSELSGHITAKDYEKFWQRYVDMRKILIQELAQPAASFLRTLSDEQIANVREEFDDSNDSYEELVKANSSKFKYKLQKRSDHLIEFYEDLLGILTPEQKAIIIASQEQTQAETRQHLILRKEVQANFISAIRKARSDAELVKLIEKWGAQPGAMGTGQAYQSLLDKRNAKRKDMIVKLDKSLSKTQRQHALKKLEEWLNDLQDIVG